MSPRRGKPDVNRSGRRLLLSDPSKDQAAATQPRGIDRESLIAPVRKSARLQRRRSLPQRLETQEQQFQLYSPTSITPDEECPQISVKPFNPTRKRKRSEELRQNHNTVMVQNASIMADFSHSKIGDLDEIPLLQRSLSHVELCSKDRELISETPVKDSYAGGCRSKKSLMIKIDRPGSRENVAKAIKIAFDKAPKNRVDHLDTSYTIDRTPSNSPDFNASLTESDRFSGLSSDTFDDSQSRALMPALKQTLTDLREPPCDPEEYSYPRTGADSYRYPDDNRPEPDASLTLILCSCSKQNCKHPPFVKCCASNDFIKAAGLKSGSLYSLATVCLRLFEGYEQLCHRFIVPRDCLEIIQKFLELWVELYLNPTQKSLSLRQEPQCYFPGDFDHDEQVMNSNYWHYVRHLGHTVDVIDNGMTVRGRINSVSYGRNLLRVYFVRSPKDGTQPPREFFDVHMGFTVPETKLLCPLVQGCGHEGTLDDLEQRSVGYDYRMNQEEVMKARRQRTSQWVGLIPTAPI